MSFLTPAWTARCRERLNDPAFAAAVAALDARAAEYHRYLPPHPERQAGYYHEFFCPDHAVQLVFDPRSPSRHVCPVDQAVFSGEPFDHAYLWSVNDMLSDAALRLALRAFLRGEAGADAARATDILTGYARRYLSLPKGPKARADFAGIVTFTGLDESVWLVRVAWAWALLDGLMPADAAREVREGLLRPAGEHMRRIRYPEIHNVTNWNNAALLALGLTLEDETLVEAALGGGLGLYAELEQGVLPDGLWWEVSLSYHYYSLAALVWTVRALEASGRGFRAWERLRAMFRAPLGLAFPDLTLPAVNDCWYFIGLTGEVGHGIPDAAGFYESAYAWLGDPEFAWVLGQNYALRPRNGMEVLLDGVAELGPGSAPELESSRLPDSGLAVLRSRHASGAPACLVLKAGPDGSVHGHPDQLAIQLFAAGARLAPDLGTAGYGIDLNDSWYRQTASHSTVLVDGVSQPPGIGRLEEIRRDPSFAVASGAVSWSGGPYDGVALRRTLVACGGYYLDLFDVEAGAERGVDWILGARGELVNGFGAGTSRAGRLTGACGYDQLAGVRERSEAEPVRLRWRLGGALLDVHLPGVAGTLCAGSGPGNPAADRLAVLVRRRRGARHRFLAALEPFPSGAEPRIRSVTWSEAGGPLSTVVVETEHGTDRWSLAEGGAAGVRLERSTR